MAHSTATSIVEKGDKNWFFVTADYGYGHALQDDATTLLKAAGGTVSGSTAYPFPGTTDFSSFLLQAQSSGANVLALASSGNDVVNELKQIAEFGLTGKMRVAGLGAFIQDVIATDPPRRRRATRHGELLLEPQRPHPRLLRPAQVAAPGRGGAELAPGWRLCRHDALPQGGEADGRRRGQEIRHQDRRGHEVDPDR